MNKCYLLMILAFMLIITVGCNNKIEGSSNELNSSKSNDGIDELSELVNKKNNEADLSPLKLTAYSDIVGATLSQPEYEKFTVNKALSVKGKIEKHQELLGNYAWMKVENLDKNEIFEYYTPIVKGEFQQTIHFFNGAGDYS